MLVLSRKIHESIVIADYITVTVMDINNGEAFVIINAPEGYEVIAPNAEEHLSNNFNSIAQQWASKGLHALYLCENEEVFMENVKLKISDIRGQNVRIGIDAPQEIPVRRQEVSDNIRHETQNAGQLESGPLDNGMHNT